MNSVSGCKLYAFVDTAYLRGRAPALVARQLCEGGADIIQLRAKNSTTEAIRALALSILPVTRAAGVPLVINDHLSIAQEVGAELCHLGQEDFFDRGYTHISQLPPGKSAVQVGLSTHAPDQAQRAVNAGAHYAAIGPVYPTGTKPTAKAVTLEYVRWAAQNVALPWFAIGGINLTNVDEVLAAGARRICIVSAILNQDDVAAACAAFKRRLTGR